MNVNVLEKNCCGCRSCEQVCPQKCIIMEENSEGFIYPKIDSTLCINCGICIKKCPIYNYENNGNIPKVYAFKNKDNNIMNSASGGACDVVARQIIKDGGIVYGVAYDTEINASYIRIRNEEDLIRIQSSKYVFADTNSSYNDIKNDLTNGTKVLFTGTSCQVDGLLTFLGKDYENLFTISIICHGAPSPKLFRNYIKYKENQIGCKITGYDFRSKDKKGWGLTEKIVCENGKVYYEDLDYTSYGHDFLKGYNYRENCYNCKYCNVNRIGDWSVGDFWGISIAHPKFNDKKGVSVLLVMSDKGQKMVDLVSNNVEILESSLSNAIIKQTNLIRPTERKLIRDSYYESNKLQADFFTSRTPKKDIKYYLKKYCPRVIKNILKRIYKK